MNRVNLLMALMHKAQHSWKSLWGLNQLLKRMIPFNAQHGFKVTNLSDDAITTYAPYQKRNFNHIRGIHACGIATIAEFAAGMMLIQTFQVNKYRLIMSHLEITYHYQAKTALKAETNLHADEKIRLQKQLKEQKAVLHKMMSKIYDRQQNLVATAITIWQIKPWSLVQTEL